MNYKYYQNYNYLNLKFLFKLVRFITKYRNINKIIIHNLLMNYTNLIVGTLFSDNTNFWIVGKYIHKKSVITLNAMIITLTYTT